MTSPSAPLEAVPAGSPTRYRLLSADDHVQEPPDLWIKRLSRAKFGDRIPSLARQADGSERWVVDGQLIPLRGAGMGAALFADRTTEPQCWADVPPMVRDPSERLKAMDADGVEASVLYPTVAGVGGEAFGRITDPELELACVQAYNDWLIEEWAAVSDRFVPQCLVPLDPPEAAAEIRRAVAMGHRGVIYPGIPMDLREVAHINDPVYDPIWATCQELGIPLCFHAGASTSNQLSPYAGFSPAVSGALEGLTRPTSTAVVLVNFLLSGILLRFPGMRVVFAESALGWAAYLLEYTDHQFENDKVRYEGQGFPLRPSELFRRQCYLTGWYDRVTMKVRDHLGVENILWCTNFPQATSSWPRSREIVDSWATGVPARERDRIVWNNAAELYRLGPTD
ncbi:MAG TPA: amidohydrolase family protein [Chloroflexota bacterium]|nr:amidohydrolase family protein [Chloroflexota bacterium]